MSSFKKIQGYWVSRLLILNISPQVNYIKWTSWILPVVFCIWAGSGPRHPDLSALCPYQQAIPFLLSITMLTAIIYAIVACSCYCCNSVSFPLLLPFNHLISYRKRSSRMDFMLSMDCSCTSSNSSASSGSTVSSRPSASIQRALTIVTSPCILPVSSPLVIPCFSF